MPNPPSGATNSSSVPDSSPVSRLPSPVSEHWDDLPIVLLDGQRVRAATAAAGRARIRAGMTIGEARARCADVRVAHWDEATVAQAVTRATAAFVQASPQVTPATGIPGTWWIGASGLEALGGEPALARRLLALARRWHPQARVAIADSCVAARAATWATAPASRPSPKRRSASTAPRVASPAVPDQARPDVPPGESGLVIVPPGGCAAYLAPAPLGLVPMDEAMRETLQALGLRTVGAFAALDGEDVERRWGDAGLAAWRLSRGEDRRRPVLARLDAPRAIATELSPSVPTMEPVLFLVRAALDRLVQDLVRDGRAAAVVAITLTLDDARGALPVPAQAHTITREVRLPRPLARVVPLLERCRALLESWRLEAPVCAVAVAVTSTAPLLGAQGELLDPAWRDPAAADAAFARLRSALGTDAVVRPVVQDTHRPEQAGTWERVEDPGDVGGRATTSGRPGTSVSPGPHGAHGNRDHHPPAVRWAAPAGHVLRARPSPTASTTPTSTTASPMAAPTAAPTAAPATSPVGAPRATVSAPAAAPANDKQPAAIAPGMCPSLPAAASLAASPTRSSIPSVVESPSRPLALVRVAPSGASPVRGAPPVHDAPYPRPAPGVPASPAISAAAGTRAASGPRAALASPLRAPALRQLETPERAEVRTADGDAASPPLAIRWREQVITVAHAIGPERLAGDWWGSTYARDYWRCEDATGAGHLVLYRDCTTSPPAWYVHAWYD